MSVENNSTSPPHCGHLLIYRAGVLPPLEPGHLNSISTRLFYVQPGPAGMIKVTCRGKSRECNRDVSLFAETLKQLVNGLGAEVQGLDRDALVRCVE